MRRFSNTLISPKTWRPSGHMLTPRAAIADPGIARNGWPSKMMSPPVTSTKPQILFEEGGLACPIGADQCPALASRHIQRDAMHGFDVAVPCNQALNLQYRRHCWCPR